MNEISYIKKEIENAGRFDDIEKTLQDLISDDAGNYSVSTFIDEYGKSCSSIPGLIIRQEAIILKELIEKDDTTLETVSKTGLYHLERYCKTNSNNLLINYGVAASHQIPDADRPSIEKIRIWCIIENLLACAVCELWKEKNTWGIPSGWKKVKVKGS